MTVHELADWLRENNELTASLLDGTYRPRPHLIKLQLWIPARTKRPYSLGTVQAGMMQDGVCVIRDEGTPQGGPLSPLLANLLLDDLDRLLESRDHRFCRYAGDCKIYVRSRAANRAKEKIRQITRRKRGVSLPQVMVELNLFLVGWLTYYRFAASRFELQCLDEWIRRKLRCYRLKQCKRGSTVAGFLKRLGASPSLAHRVASSGKGWWRLRAFSLVLKYDSFQH